MFRPPQADVKRKIPGLLVDEIRKQVDIGKSLIDEADLDSAEGREEIFEGAC